MSPISNGILFVFEGVDNVGKSTIVKEVSRIFENKNILHSVYSFPGKEAKTLGGLVYDFHHNQEKYISYYLNNSSLQLLHVASHIDLLIRCIIPDLDQGKIVLLDRSWWSTYAYGIANDISKNQMKLILASELNIWEKIVIGQIFLINREQENGEFPKITKKTQKAYEELIELYKGLELVYTIHNNGNISDVVFEIETIILREIDKFNNQQKAE